MDLSVIIPTRSGSPTLRACLQSCADQSLVNKGQVEVLVVVNGGPRDPHLEGEFGHFVWLESVRGAGAARNTGFQQARGKWVYFLDDDCQLSDSRHLETLVGQCCHEEHWIVGGPYWNGPTASKTAKGFNLLANQWVESGRSRQWVTRLLGGNFVANKETLITALGTNKLFEERIKYGASESELFQRLQDHHFQFVFHEELGVLHNPEISFFEAVRKSFLQGQNEAKYLGQVPRRPLLKLFKEFRETSAGVSEKSVAALLWGTSFLGRKIS